MNQLTKKGLFLCFLMVFLCVVVALYSSTASALVTVDGNVSLISGGTVHVPAETFTCTQVNYTSSIVTFENFNIPGSDWNKTIGFWCDSGTTMNISSVTLSQVKYSFDAPAGQHTSKIYIFDTNYQPYSITGGSYSYAVSGLVTVTTNHASTVAVTLFLDQTYNYTIQIYAYYSEVETGKYTLLYANCYDVNNTSHDGNVTFTIDDARFEWNSATSRYEAQDKRSSQATVTYNTVDEFADTEYPVASGTLNNSVSVSWVKSSLDYFFDDFETGDIFKALIDENVALFTQVGLWSLFMMALSIGMYNWQGPEITLLAWVLGWGAFSVYVHSYARIFGVLFMAIGGGLMTARLFQDRRM